MIQRCGTCELQPRRCRDPLVGGHVGSVGLRVEAAGEASEFQSSQRVVACVCSHCKKHRSRVHPLFGLQRMVFFQGAQDVREMVRIQIGEIFQAFRASSWARGSLCPLSVIRTHVEVALNRAPNSADRRLFQPCVGVRRGTQSSIGQEAECSISEFHPPKPGELGKLDINSRVPGAEERSFG